MDPSRPSSPRPPAALQGVELRVAEVVGGLMEFWGFKAVMGRLWAVLYLSPEPLSAPELCERLSLSSGAVSMALSDLQKWGVVRKAWRPGERRDYYEPETSIWKMVSRVFRERELERVREAGSAFAEALAAVEAARRESAGEEERSRLKFVQGRLDALLTLARLGEGLLNLLVAGAAIDPQPIKSLFDRVK